MFTDLNSVAAPFIFAPIQWSVDCVSLPCNFSLLLWNLWVRLYYSWKVTLTIFCLLKEGFLWQWTWVTVVFIRCSVNIYLYIVCSSSYISYFVYQWTLRISLKLSKIPYPIINIVIWINTQSVHLSVFNCQCRFNSVAPT